jgi:hypothetical protein
MSDSSFYSNTGTTSASISSIATLNAAATASKDAAAVSAAASATSATGAATSATASEVSNAAALVSKNAAATSASTATTKADLATSNGATQVALATAQVVLATEQKTLSIAQVALATTKADNAATSATAAASSQSSATASASTATTKASEAAASAVSAAASLDLFTDQYLGSKSSAPSVDNDGDALTTGDLYYDSTASSMKYWSGSAWVSAYISAAGMAALSGATFTGNVTVPGLVLAGSGTVDGRDVSADGTKLDGIEASATADQSNAEIRAAVEAASDSNVFTDADHTKLNAIEASATADQTNDEIKAAVEAASDSNTFTDADHTKLNAIEASADVTDATNVTAAGALMDSEVTNLAQVKAFAASDYATAAQGTLAAAALPKSGGAMTGAITTNSTFDGVDIATRDAVLTSTTTTANAALPKAGGTVTGNVIHNDNVKALFGTGSDLEIYHDASNSYVKDSGTGNLQLLGSSYVVIGSATGAGEMISAQSGAEVNLKFNNSNKLVTSATGVTITGTAIATTDTDTSNTGNVTLDFAANQNFVLTLTGNTTLVNPSTEQVGQSGFITLIQDGTGGRTLSLGTDYETAGGAGITLTSTASATDIIPYVVAAAGRILLGSPQLAFS